MTTVTLNQGRKLETSFWRRIVLERLHRLFIIVILLQLIQCLQGYWWEETYTVIYFTMAVMVVTELLMTRSLFLRLLLQLCGAAAGIWIYTPYKWQGGPESWRHWADVRQFLVVHGKAFHPYLEIAFGLVLIVHYVSALGTSRVRAGFFIIVAILTMAIVDSFFPYELWQHIAWMVLASLGWLVVLHMRELRERHYDSWDALAERPFELAVPAVLVIGLLMLAGVAVPRAPVLLSDPYTIWLESQNKAVPAFSGEGGIINVSDPGTGNSGSSAKSGYGRSDSKIGGGFEFDYSPVMEVTTSQKAYWRGESKAVYTGQGWTDLKNVATTPVSPGGAQLPLEPAIPSGVETKKVTQTFTILRKDRFPVLFAAGPVSNLMEWQGVSGKLTWSPEEWELKFQRPTAIESYTVVSNVPILDEEKLRQTTSTGSGSTFDITPYLQLPDSLPPRVKALAVRVTEKANNDYDRAKFLESYLRLNFPYKNQPNTSLQKSKDITDAFLFEIKEGYCDYYSTAFVVLARTLGMPTRWVKGYTTGMDPRAEEMARMGAGFTPDPTGAGTYTVRNADAHSWAEIYFQGVGWVSFEPTAGFSVPQAFKEGESSAQVIDPTPDSSTDSDTSDKKSSMPAWLPMTTAITGFLLVAGASIWLFVRRRSGKPSLLRRIRHRSSSPNQRIVRDMEGLLLFLNRKGMKRSPNDTLRESFQRWGTKSEQLRPDFEGVLQRFENARYGGGSGLDSDWQQFDRLADKIRKAL